MIHTVGMQANVVVVRVTGPGLGQGPTTLSKPRPS